MDTRYFPLKQERHPDGGDVSRGGFDVYFPNDQWHWACSHVSVIWGEKYVQVFCPFLNWLAYLVAIVEL